MMSKTEVMIYSPRILKKLSCVGNELHTEGLQKCSGSTESLGGNKCNNFVGRTCTIVYHCETVISVQTL
jgi:hypothetical protein